MRSKSVVLHWLSKLLPLLPMETSEDVSFFGGGQGEGWGHTRRSVQLNVINETFYKESLQVLLIRHYYALLTPWEISAEVIKSIKRQCVHSGEKEKRTTKENTRPWLSNLGADGQLLFKNLCSLLTYSLKQSGRSLARGKTVWLYFWSSVLPACICLRPWQGGCEWQVNNGYYKTNNILLSCFQI